MCPRLPPSLRVFALLLALGSVLAGCGEAQRAHDDVTTPVVGEFWLKNTTLLVAPNGSPLQHIGEPVLVELSSNGRVRGVRGSGRDIDGYLPKDVLDGPQDHRGLMLYARTLTELRFEGVLGPAVGRLHPGALVSVVKQGMHGMLVGSLPFRTSEQRNFVGWVRADALGTEPIEPEEYRGEVGDRSYIVGNGIGPHFEVPSLGAPRWWPCEPILFADQSRFGSQIIYGVELRGLSLSPPSENYPPYPRTDSFSHCPARHVVRRGESLVLVNSRGEKLVRKIPSELARIRDDGREAFRDWIQRQESIFLLVMTDEKTVACSSLRFVRPRMASTQEGGLLESDLEYLSRENGPTLVPTHYYFEEDASKLTMLVMDGERPGSSDQCDVLRYTLVHTSETEFQLLPFVLPSDAIAYDPQQVEPWFRSEAACRKASAAATLTLRTRGDLAHTLGIHGVPTGHTGSLCGRSRWE